MSRSAVKQFFLHKAFTVTVKRLLPFSEGFAQQNYKLRNNTEHKK